MLQIIPSPRNYARSKHAPSLYSRSSHTTQISPATSSLQPSSASSSSSSFCSASTTEPGPTQSAQCADSPSSYVDTSGAYKCISIPSSNRRSSCQFPSLPLPTMSNLKIGISYLSQLALHSYAHPFTSASHALSLFSTPPSLAYAQNGSLSSSSCRTLHPSFFKRAAGQSL